MERPLSAASSGTALSTTSGPSLKRNASIKVAGKPSGSSVVSLFVTNLRLLHLDLLADWPGITVSSFSNHDARTKIKCTEYALYHLFRLYDYTTTADKLKPFFPPLEPLQSVNLRSALFRCLNELKKNGVLPKETVLRKTMLDECQGEKFWEMCLGFSAIVLRKITLEKSAKYGRPLAELIGTTQVVSARQKESMLPLAIAHKAALSKVLDDRRKKKETYIGLYDLLVEKEDGLRQRKAKSELHAHQMKVIKSEKLKSIENAVQKSWVGSTELKEALIDGDTCEKGDGILVQSFDQVWQSDDFERRSEACGAEVGLLQSLNNRATEQTLRLRKWQDVHDKLIAVKPPSARPSRPGSGTHKPVAQFDRHRDLTLRDTSPDSERPFHQLEPRHTSALRYDEILTAMREELRRNYNNRSSSQPSSTQPLKRAHTQQTPARRLNSISDTSPGAKNPHARSPSLTSVPVRPRFGRSVSSQSRSYEKPKVESQRQPIPLKAELFSPLKEKRMSVSPMLTTSIGESKMEEVKSPRTKVDSVIGVREKDGVQNRNSTGSSNGDFALGVQNATLPHRDSAVSSPTNENNEDQAMQMEALKTQGLTARKTFPEGAVSRPSLAERTRMSMAFNGAETANQAELATPVTVPTGSRDVVAQVHPQPRRNSLLERTRQSISMAPPSVQAPRSKKQSHNRSKTAAYPINQFEAAMKVSHHTVSPEEDARRNTTPIEQLLSPDAEYNSVFKSRPRIAQSPTLSPCGDAETNGNSEVGRSSPLVDVRNVE